MLNRDLDDGRGLLLELIVLILVLPDLVGLVILCEDPVFETVNQGLGLLVSDTPPQQLTL
jgi:hypothetical protein